MEGYRRRPRRGDVSKQVWQVQERRTTVDERIETRGKTKNAKKIRRKRRNTHTYLYTRYIRSTYIYGGVERKDRNEKIFAQPNELRENTETAISRK